MESRNAGYNGAASAGARLRLPLPAPTLALLLLGGCAPKEEDTEEVVEFEDADGDGWPAPEDCDDANPYLAPGVPEYCNGADDDCDGVTDDHPADGLLAWLDWDGDGFGDSSTRDRWCGDPSVDPRPWVSVDGDCDDGSAAVNPGAFESCATDGDDDCDGDDNDPGGLGCTRWYQDLDGDGVGTESSTCICDAEGGWAAQTSGDCDDLDPDVTEGCALTGGRTLGDEERAIVGFRGASVGSVTAVGDPDGDGAADLVVSGAATTGGPWWWFLRGPFPADRDLLGASASLAEPVFAMGVGATASGGEDLDGDGADDLVLGGYGSTSSSSSRFIGIVRVISGAPTGSLDLDRADATFVTPVDTVAANLALAASPDTDGDGRADLLVGASGLDTAWLFSGPLEGGVTAAEATATVSGAGTSIGQALAGAGDVDGDGLCDLLLAGPRLGDRAQGGALLLLGGRTGILAPEDADAVLEGPADAISAGAGVAGPGDVDGDGHADVLIGGMGADFSGVTWLVPGPLDGTVDLDDAAAEIAGLSSGDAAWRVAGAGDVDADGNADVLVGAAGVDLGGTDAGAAALFFGPISGSYLFVEADLRLYGAAAGDAAGGGVAGLGDLDGDGYADVGIGAPGSDVGGADGGAIFLLFGSAR